MVALPDVQEKAAGHTAAVEGHRQPDSSQLFRLHGPAQREQHTELGLRGVEMCIRDRLVLRRLPEDA